MPREFMCPHCARIVDPRDEACDGCGTDLRALPALESPNSTPDPWWHILGLPWAVGLIALALLFCFALVARGSVTLLHAYLVVAIAVPVLGIALVKLAKLRDGFDAFLDYLFRPPIAKWLTDDPLDWWMIVVIVVSFITWIMLGAIVAPSVP
jgi:hypothetical protein